MVEMVISLYGIFRHLRRIQENPRRRHSRICISKESIGGAQICGPFVGTTVQGITVATCKGNGYRNSTGKIRMSKAEVFRGLRLFSCNEAAPRYSC